MNTRKEEVESKSVKPLREEIKYEYFTDDNPTKRHAMAISFIVNFKKDLDALNNSFYHGKISEEEVKNYVKNNKKQFQEAVSISASIDSLIDIFLKVDNVELLLLLDANWLKELPVFNHSFTLGRFLYELNPEYWNLLLDDFLGSWFKNFCLDIDNLADLLKTLPTPEKFTQETDVTLKTLLNYLGQSWLRENCFYNTTELAYLFQRFNSTYRMQPVLEFLDGEHRWLDTIMDGAGLGHILKSFNMQGTLPSVYVLNCWKVLLNFVNLESIIQNPIQLNALLTHLVCIPYILNPEFKSENKKYNQLSTDNIELFLTNYTQNFLNHHRFTSIMQLIEELLELSCSMESNTSSYAVIKNIGIIRSFSHKEMYEIVFVSRVQNHQMDYFTEMTNTVKETLSHMNLYKNKPYYKALLLAVAKGYYHKREQEPENTGYFDYTKKDILASTESLIQSIIVDEPVDRKNFPAIGWGDLGEISRLYTGDSGIKATFKYYLLGNLVPQPSQQTLVEEEAPQLTDIDKESPKVSGP